MVNTVELLMMSLQRLSKLRRKCYKLERRYTGLVLNLCAARTIDISSPLDEDLVTEINATRFKHEVASAETDEEGERANSLIAKLLAEHGL